MSGGSPCPGSSGSSSRAQNKEVPGVSLGPRHSRRQATHADLRHRPQHVCEQPQHNSMFSLLPKCPMDSEQIHCCLLFILQGCRLPLLPKNSVKPMTQLCWWCGWQNTTSLNIFVRVFSGNFESREEGTAQKWRSGQITYKCNYFVNVGYIENPINNFKNRTRNEMVVG